MLINALSLHFSSPGRWVCVLLYYVYRTMDSIVSPHLVFATKFQRYQENVPTHKEIWGWESACPGEQHTIKSVLSFSISI